MVGRAVIRPLILAAFVTPSFLGANAWIFLAAPNSGMLNQLWRAVFHTEHGLNIPGHRMAEARRAYESETDAGRKRVKGAMYAGALFNRATNIFTRLVDLQSTGVEISASNDLMRECGRCLEEALSLCRLVLHRSGEEGIDELWGEHLPGNPENALQARISKKA